MFYTKMQLMYNLCKVGSHFDINYAIINASHDNILRMGRSSI